MALQTPWHWFWSSPPLLSWFTWKKSFLHRDLAAMAESAPSSVMSWVGCGWWRQGHPTVETMALLRWLPLYCLE